MENSNLAGKLKVVLSQNKVLTDLLIRKICGVTSNQLENHNANK